MNTPVIVGAVFRERYAVQRFRDGGIVVDLATGTYLRLNVSAAEILSSLEQADSIGSARLQVAQILGATEGAAERAIQDAMEGLGRLSPRREPLGAFRYFPSQKGGYVLSSNGSPRVWISADGTSVRLAKPDDPIIAARIVEYLRAVAPKLLFLQSVTVIHGAASRTGTGGRVIAGESGAGKTTTARSFEEAGWGLFAEDMLVVATLSPLRVYSVGENVINAWAARSAERLTGSPHEEIEASTLRAASNGEPTAVSEIWFLDGGRREQSGNEICPRRLGETDGALAMMASLFLGAASPTAWRLFLALAGEVASAVPLFEALMPAGLDRLRAAAQRYTENSASK
jgi:hypothetical protein